MRDERKAGRAVGKVVIGIDGGTTAVKSVAFDLGGRVVSLAHRRIPVFYGSGGEAEQDAHVVWESVVDTLQGVTDGLPADTEILAVGMTGQGDGCWLFDAEVEPLGPAPNWMDGRAYARVRSWEADDRGDALAEITGGAPFPGLAPVLLEHLKDDAPDTYAKARYLLCCKDWIRYRLTGEIATDFTEASRSFLDVRTARGYSAELADRIGMPEVLGLLPEIRRADTLGGTITADAAERTGLPAGTPVAVGMVDVAATGFGLQAAKNGDGWLILDTTGFVGRLTESLEQRRSAESTVLATGSDRQIIEFMAPMIGTPNLEWIRHVLGLEKVKWADLETRAEIAGPGAGGVIYLPYASPGGERAPFLDPAASSSWLGMNLTTSPDQMLRAVYEGVAFSLTECISALHITGDLIASGEGFRSDLICQILADTTGQRVVRQDAPEAGARGAAALALTCAGIDPDLETAADRLATGTHKFDPDPEVHDAYRHAFDVFVHARREVRPVWPQMRELRVTCAALD